MTSPLIDAEGFPLSGLDITAVRTARQQIRMLTNDRQTIDAQLKFLLEHALAKNASASDASSSSRSETSTRTIGPHDHAAPIPGEPVESYSDTTSQVPSPSNSVSESQAQPKIQERPIAVRSVAPGSPAAVAGLCAGDVLMHFGDLRSLTSAHFSQLAAQVQDGVSIPIGVERLASDGRKRTIDIVLTPSSAWGGRGLLGYVLSSPSCHLVPT